MIEEKALLSLLEEARKGSQQAYAPYSGYRVGAALLCSSGEIVIGCNVENSSFSLTICAERNAVFHAVAEGIRDFAGLAIWVESDVLFPPCGACRQVLTEFNPELPIIYGNKNQYIITDLGRLLPSAFSLNRT